MSPLTRSSASLTAGSREVLSGTPSRHYRDGVDELRKQELRRLQKELPKAAQDDLKRTLWPFRKRADDLDAEEKERLEGVLVHSPALRHAYTLREKLTTIFDTARSN